MEAGGFLGLIGQPVWPSDELFRPVKDPVSKEVASVPEDAIRGCPLASTCTYAQMCVQTNVRRGMRGERGEERRGGERETDAISFKEPKV